MRYKIHPRVVLAIAAMLLVVCGVVLFFVMNNKKNNDSVEAVTQTIAKHMVLPIDEVPALLTVTDPSKVSTQFLKQSQVGDKILIYQKYKRVIIYRPSIDRIIDIGPVVIDNPKVSNE
jgi:F0F1-type ATP synthase gamma subunit